MASLNTISPSVNRSVDSPSEIPPDVLAGLAGYAGVIRSRYPERVPAYCEQLAAALDQLPHLGKAHEAPRFAAFLALLSVGEATT
jgi:hypothetical protein